MAGKFVLSKAKNGKFHFSLKAGNGEIIATSQMYDSKSGALNGIDSVKKNAAVSPVDDQSDKPAE